MAGFFFFQAEDGIRDLTVTGVQTCALPICVVTVRLNGINAIELNRPGGKEAREHLIALMPIGSKVTLTSFGWDKYGDRSEEHTSELQSQSNLVCRLLLEKKKQHM